MARAWWITGIVAALSGCAAAPPPRPPPARPAVQLGPSKARPIEPEVAAQLLQQVAAAPPAATMREHGQRAAMTEIAYGGPLMLQGVGYPSGCARSGDFTAILFAEYDIYYVDSAGCIVSVDSLAYHAGYNEVMQAEIERRYGPVLAEAAARASCRL